GLGRPAGAALFPYTSLFRSARLPQRLVARVGPEAEDEEQVREPVEVAHDLGVGVLDEQRAALGAAADRAADVQPRGGGRPAREQDRKSTRLNSSHSQIPDAG